MENRNAAYAGGRAAEEVAIGSITTGASRNSETGGHGIGLSVAKAIVTSHGGKIRAFAEEGGTFTVTAIFPG